MTKRSQRKRSDRRAAAVRSQKTAKENPPTPTKTTNSAKRDGGPWLYVAIGAVLVILVLVWLFGTPYSPLKNQAGSATPQVLSWSEPPAMSIDKSKTYYATIKTELGDIRLQLYADKAPVTVNSFIFLARQGYYDNMTFHRVLSEFMAQTGDPTGTGSGGPGYSLPDEIDPSLTFDRAGLLAMANKGAPNTAGSQFFITLAPTEWLNGGYTIFGEVVNGMDVVQSLGLRDPQTPDLPPGTKVLTIEIEES